jgi:hypothetical protein
MMPTYCERQANAVLKICANCRRAIYMTVPSYGICMACRAGRQPIGPVIPRTAPLCDVSGNSIDGP